MKKVLCLIMSVLMLSSVVACADTQRETPETASADTADEENTDELPAVEKKSYNETFLMVGFVSAGTWYYAEEQTKEVLNDAIYEMNQRVNDYLGVTVQYKKIDEVTGAEIFTTVQPTVAAGDDAYQLCIMHPFYSYTSFIGENYAYDFYDFDTIDWDKPYWNKSVVDSLSIDGKAYIALGDLCKYKFKYFIRQ